MYFAILIILFIAVFAFLFWRILFHRSNQRPPEPAAAFVCPVCNEYDCECRKVDDIQ